MLNKISMQSEESTNHDLQKKDEREKEIKRTGDSHEVGNE